MTKIFINFSVLLIPPHLMRLTPEVHNYLYKYFHGSNETILVDEICSQMIFLFTVRSTKLGLLQIKLSEPVKIQVDNMHTLYSKYLTLERFHLYHKFRSFNFALKIR